MINNKQREYYFSLTPLIIGLVMVIVLAALIAIICFVFFYVIINYKDFEFKNNFFIILFCLFFIPLFTMFFIENIQRLIKSINCYFNKIPALILTPVELIDNLNSKRYKWLEIKEISIDTVMQYRAPPVLFISIILNDSESLINSIINPYKRYNAKINQKKYGTSYLLNTNSINCNRENLFEELNKYLNN